MHGRPAIIRFCCLLLFVVRLPFVLTWRLLAWLQAVAIRWYDAVAFILGMPTFWEKLEAAEAIDILSHSTRELRRENLESLTEIRHLNYLNKALTKISHTHAEKIKTLEAELVDERRKFADLNEKYERIFR